MDGIAEAYGQYPAGYSVEQRLAGAVYPEATASRADEGRGGFAPVDGAASVQIVPLARIGGRLGDPRADAGTDLEALARSMGGPGNMTLAQYPAVEQLAPGEYRVICGARRLGAARLA